MEKTACRLRDPSELRRLTNPFRAMNSEIPPHDDDVPVIDPECDTVYSLEVFAGLAGVDTQVVLHYQELGLLSPVAHDAAEGALFDSECLRLLRRIEHLRCTCELNDAALRMILRLLDEVERLRQERRQMTR